MRSLISRLHLGRVIIRWHECLPLLMGVRLVDGSEALSEDGVWVLDAEWLLERLLLWMTGWKVAVLVDRGAGLIETKAGDWLVKENALMDSHVFIATELCRLLFFILLLLLQLLLFNLGLQLLATFSRSHELSEVENLRLRRRRLRRGVGGGCPHMCLIDLVVLKLLIVLGFFIVLDCLCFL